MFDILIADDDKNWRELAEETFSIAGYLCDFAFDGQQAIKKLETEKYKLVCINWKLRDYQHGRALLRRLHSQYPEIPVILTSLLDLGTMLQKSSVKILRTCGQDIQT